jgi:glycosyltransferase involved in cell wall biosynthesis
MMNDSTPGLGPLVSVILPAHNADQNIAAALDALAQQTYGRYEVIVIDDGSTDATNEICQKYPYTLLVQQRGGIASAQNAGAALSKGEILYFTDADVSMRPDTLQQVVETLTNNPEVIGLSGCYSGATLWPNFFSVYKNALHRYVHRSNGPYTINLFGGNSAIWKKVFNSVGGFDPQQKILEDVELGFRLVRAGHRILMARDIEVVHRKKYTFASMVYSDVCGRAVPWVLIMLKNRRIHFDLNLRPRNILSFIAVWSILLALYPLNLPWSAICILGSVIVFCFLNAGLLRSMRNQSGWLFALKAAPLAYFSYFYQGVGLTLGVWRYLHKHRNAEPALSAATSLN